MMTASSTGSPCELGEIADEFAEEVLKIKGIKELRHTDPEERINYFAYDPDSTGRDRLEEAKTAFEIEEQFGYF
ncbi:MAG: hypothetical protein P8X74_09965 [Reinekea sp.]|jgi:hypothetical protein